MSAELVSVTQAGGVATITVHRPKVLNALNRRVLEELADAVAAVAADAGVRAVVLRGEGDRAFVAGADISEFVGATPADAIAISQRMRRLTDALVACPKPVVAMIHGYCLGGGFELALACDIRIASTEAKFGLPEIKLGILPGGGGTVRLSKIAGSSVARMMAMTGEPIDAARAHGLGLVVSLHEPADLEAATAALAARLASLAPFALAQLKSSLNIAVDADMASALETETKAFALCYSTEDQEEGAKAFLEKRKANFTGK